MNFELARLNLSLYAVNDSLPSVTVIIAARPDLADIKAVTSARAFDYPNDKLDIIVARGRQPSVQRNAALRAARGELIYFLDDDSVVSPDKLRRAISHFSSPKVEIVGGPNLCPPDAPEVEQAFALVMTSWLAFMSSRARYAQVGRVRETGEKELILCNLIARRKTMLRHGGFNEALYPNEENALMDEIQKQDGKLIYDPEFFVYRRPRSTLKSYVRMLLNYGRGRAEQVRLHPTTGSAPNFIPALFCVYLIVLPFVLWMSPAFFAPYWLAPLALYVLALLIQTAALIPSGGITRSLLGLPLIILTHSIYGVGFWRGLFTKLKAPHEPGATPVALETVTR